MIAATQPRWKKFFRISTQLQLWLLAGLIFLVPSNLFLKINEDSGYVQGIFLDYLVAKFYLSDLLILSFLIVWFTTFLWRFKPNSLAGQFTRFKLTPLNSLVGSLWLLIAIHQMTLNIHSAWWSLISIGFVGLLVTAINSERQLFTKPLICVSWIGALLAQTGLSIFQFVTQRSFYGYLLLGEPDLNTPYGLATTSWQGRELVLPYGTTPHPNILAGFAVVSWWGITILAKRVWPRSAPHIVGIVSLLTLLILVMTQSVSAALAWIVMGGVWICRQTSLPKLSLITLAILLMVPIGLFFMAEKYDLSPSITHRVELQRQALLLWRHSPIFGVGWGQFGAVLAQKKLPSSLQHFIQPVHHVPLLWLSEMGLVGVGALSLTGYLWAKKSSSSQIRTVLTTGLILSPILALDHYLITQHTGWLLIILTLLVTRLHTNPKL